MVLVPGVAEFMDDEVVYERVRKFDGFGVNDNIILWGAAPPAFVLLPEL